MKVQLLYIGLIVVTVRDLWAGTPKALRLLNRSLVCQMCGEPDREVASLRAAVREAAASLPEYLAEARAGLGQALWHRGDADEAIEVTRQAVGGSFRSENDRYEAHRLLGTMLAVRGDVDEARAVLREVLRGWPLKRDDVLRDLLTAGGRLEVDLARYEGPARTMMSLHDGAQVAMALAEAGQKDEAFAVLLLLRRDLDTLAEADRGIVRISVAQALVQCDRFAAAMSEFRKAERELGRDNVAIAEVRDTFALVEALA